MERQIPIAKAKNRLTAIIHDVENGPAVKLTRHGKPVAVLLSAQANKNNLPHFQIQVPGAWGGLVRLAEIEPARGTKPQGIVRLV